MGNFWKKAGCASVITALLAGMPVYGAGWQQDDAGRRWQKEDGTYLTAQWQWLDEDGDGVSQCYYFDENGYLLTQTTTPDGCTVNEQGAWVQDGKIQTQVSAAESGSGTFTKCTMKTSQLDSFQYWLYTPPGATENMPLIISLHGAKNTFVDDSYSLAYLLKNGELTVPAYVAFPVKPDHHKGAWGSLDASVVELVSSLAGQYKTDSRRVSIYGISAGGAQTVRIAARHPEVFASVVAVSPATPIRSEEVEALAGVAVAYMAGAQEVPTMRQDCENSVNALRQAGISTKFILVSGADHKEVTRKGFLNPEYGVLEWMLQNSKS
jgi:pimeloyl-ACP methyl ester carboxylesterase